MIYNIIFPNRIYDNVIRVELLYYDHEVQFNLYIHCYFNDT